MLNGYEIAMLLTIAASFICMMWLLFRALELEAGKGGPTSWEAKTRERISQIKLH
ncbi:hypothetical protein QWY20_17480 [Alkalimonas sp. MEB108]|uniref:Uncharacterized protein n=1 Tax=Alkalimonas cellulosilytica TaxID=3058395 RepID=A0ABU7J9M4_9GAMM|nr:hypothetical protein [Alkalimonas sp. MEB108]MEE2003248.1 hypothetical protein [Alkalimonas sp. MEB108]